MRISSPEARQPSEPPRHDQAPVARHVPSMQEPVGSGQPRTAMPPQPLALAGIGCHFQAPPAAPPGPAPLDGTNLYCCAITTTVYEPIDAYLEAQEAHEQVPLGLGASRSCHEKLSQELALLEKDIDGEH